MEYLRKNIDYFVAEFIGHILFIKLIEEYLLEKWLLKPIIDFFLTIELLGNQGKCTNSWKDIMT